jgi:hypothetical protein
VGLGGVMPATLTIRPIEEGRYRGRRRGLAVGPPPAWTTETTAIKDSVTRDRWRRGRTASMDIRRTAITHASLSRAPARHTRAAVPGRAAGSASVVGFAAVARPAKTGRRGVSWRATPGRARGSLRKFPVIPAECSVGRRRLVIICPYPLCDALEAARCERSA